MKHGMRGRERNILTLYGIRDDGIPEPHMTRKTLQDRGENGEKGLIKDK